MVLCLSVSNIHLKLRKKFFNETVNQFNYFNTNECSSFMNWLIIALPVFTLFQKGKITLQCIVTWWIVSQMKPLIMFWVWHALIPKTWTEETMDGNVAICNVWTENSLKIQHILQSSSRRIQNENERKNQNKWKKPPTNIGCWRQLKKVLNSLQNAHSLRGIILRLTKINFFFFFLRTCQCHPLYKSAVEWENTH